MTPEDKMALLFAADAAPARDLAFEAGVAQAVAVRRLWAAIGAMVPLVIAAAAVLWGLRPVWAVFEASDAAGVFLSAGLTSGAVLAVGAGLLLFATRRWTGLWMGLARGV